MPHSLRLVIILAVLLSAACVAGPTETPGTRPEPTAAPGATTSTPPAASATGTAGAASATPAASTTPGPVSSVFLPSVANGTPPPEAAASPTPRPAPTQVAAAATPTPQPTPTPRPPLRVTKLGVGVYSGGDRMIQALDIMRPSVILLMDPNPDWARKIRGMFPKAFIIGRIYVPDQPLDNPEARGAAFADMIAQHAVPLKGVIDAWMSYNEVTDRTRKETYVNYNTFQVAFARRLQDHYGISAVAGNDASATVEPEDYATYFREAIEASDYFGVHLYAPKGINSMRHPDGQYLMLRYREIKAALDRHGVEHGPFIITEAGLWDGWRNATTEAEMAEDFIWYAEQLNQDPYVIGTTIYGLFDWERSDWHGFNVYPTSIMERIGIYNSEPSGS